jgi:hypothetical protein
MILPRGIVPLLIVLLTLGGLAAARLIAIPSLEVDYPMAEGADRSSVRVVTFLIDGVKCVDTASQAASTLEDLAGVRSFVAYASRNRVDVSHDPALVGVEELREALEGPVFDEESGEFIFGAFAIVEIDGKPVSK